MNESDFLPVLWVGFLLSKKNKKEQDERNLDCKHEKFAGVL